MLDTAGPETLKAVAKGLQSSVTTEQFEALVSHTEAWEAERADRLDLADQLEIQRASNRELKQQLDAAQQKLEELERDRKWWQDNAIRRRKRAAMRRSGLPPDDE